MRVQIVRFSCFLSLLGITSLALLPTAILAHGGEDHGEQKPKSTANAKGVVSHSARIGDFEVMIKHPALTPDTAASGRLFITKFETNEPIKGSAVTVEIESANGTITTAAVEESEQAGTYTLTIPALPDGTYTIRAKRSYDGETDTVTFAGVDVKPAASVADGETSWLTKAIIVVVFSLVMLLLSGLVYFVWRFAAGSNVNEEALSA